MLAVILIVCGILIGLLMNKGCSNEPLTYGVEKLEKRTGVDFMCSCAPENNPLDDFWFDDKLVYEENPLTNYFRL